MRTSHLLPNECKREILARLNEWKKEYDDTAGSKRRDKTYELYGKWRALDWVLRMDEE